MYLYFLGLIAARKHWEENYKENPNTPYTAEYGIGYALSMKPYYFFLLEVLAEVGVFLFLMFKFDYLTF